MVSRRDSVHSPLRLPAILRRVQRRAVSADQKGQLHVPVAVLGRCVRERQGLGIATYICVLVHMYMSMYMYMCTQMLLYIYMYIMNTYTYSILRAQVFDVNVYAYM